VREKEREEENRKGDMSKQLIKQDSEVAADGGVVRVTCLHV